MTSPSSTARAAEDAVGGDGAGADVGKAEACVGEAQAERETGGGAVHTLMDMAFIRDYIWLSWYSRATTAALAAISCLKARTQACKMVTCLSSTERAAEDAVGGNGAGADVVKVEAREGEAQAERETGGGSGLARDL